jgi:hypothetical protein
VPPTTARATQANRFILIPNIVPSFFKHLKNLYKNKFQGLHFPPSKTFSFDKISKAIYAKKHPAL